jgi:hypothetical protein
LDRRHRPASSSYICNYVFEIPCNAARVLMNHNGQDHERAVACFMDDVEACIAHLRFPVTQSA